VAFLLSVCLTAVLIIILYFRRGLTKGLYSPIDRAFVSRLRSRRGGQHNYDPDHPLNEALRKLLLNLSDQQLAGGLSLAVVVYIRFSKGETLSVYAFQMATSTVFMACLTHMSTLGALPDEFATDGGRFPRLIAMVALALLLIPILVISNLPSYALDLSL
jgi:hypothetical protein